MHHAIQRCRKTHDLDLWAYVIRPNHVHLLIHPTQEESSISRVLSSLKQPVSKKAILYVKQQAPEKLPRLTGDQPSGKSSLRFWQRGGGYDRNLWSPRYVWETIDYNHENPVRRGLCGGPTDWRWSSARAFADGSDEPLRIDFESLPDDPRRINAP